MRRSVNNVAAVQPISRRKPVPQLKAHLNQALVRVRQEPRSGGLLVLFALWVTFLFDPHWYLAAKGPDIVLKLPVILFLALWAFLSFGMLTKESWQRRWQWFPPFLLLLIIGGIGVPMAINIGYAKNTWQGYVLWWTLIVGTLAIIDSPRRAEFLLYLYGLQFLW